jgi:hypothetical protein
MRPANVVWILVLGLVSSTAPPAAAQDRVAPAEVAPQVAAQRDSLAQSTLRARGHRDSAVKERKPDAGPRLPEFIAPVRPPEDAAAAGPSGNIVIPVTTALIVLAVVVLVLLID